MDTSDDRICIGNSTLTPRGERLLVIAGLLVFVIVAAFVGGIETS